MCILAYSCDGYTVYVLAMLTLMPDYSCVNNEGLVFKCEARDTCTDTYNTFIQQPYDSKYTQSGYFINWESLTSLHNWVGSLDLRCASPMQIGMLGSVFFIGLGLGTIALAHVGDMYGRIKPVRIGLSLSLITFTMIIFIQINIYLTYLFLFTLGFLSTIRLNLSFIYGSEVFKEKHASLMGSASLGIDSLTMVTASIYFKYISKEWTYLYYFFLFLAIIPFLISLFMPESPKYLVQKRQYEQARHAFNHIAKLNGTEPLHPETDILFYEHQKIANNKKEQNEQVKEMQQAINQSTDSLIINSNTNKNQNNSINTTMMPDISTIDDNNSNTQQQMNNVEQSDLMNVLRRKKYQINYATLLLAWCASSYAYYMIGFYLKYIPGDIYLNFIVSAITEAIGCQVSGPLANFFGPSKTLTVSFVLAGAFGLQLNFIDEQNQLLIIICLLITKFGVSVAISLCYLITTAYFPILNASRVFSYLCAKAKFFAMLAPLGAEVKGSFPLVSMSLACFVSAATAFMLEKHSDNDGDLQMSYEVNDKDKQGNEELEK
eukprot:403346452